ncbi:Endonuclease/exonuclease/phosphatase [Truncatella angustata]|uniref:Endonuclease/exonuclease/phosphatase n=1 Tax=Truncatella angustata TaxID=152316 RepID=A0A9P8RHT2_9PEZI|nr:Endonuclease/exonuclease/phosphatase [Truncatella angustata]KAH6646079.1 Endonuclease/exonuclease/phosphatase [Truncatella angustata]
MSFMSSVRTRYLAWSHSTPLPDLSDAAPPVFQHWHIFDKSTCKWVFVQPSPLNAQGRSETSTPIPQTPNLQLLTWNIDAFGGRHEARMEGILSSLQQMLVNGNCPDIVLFQEVSRKALAYLLQNAWAREFWISSEADETNWADVPFATMTLLSRSRFGGLSGNPGSNPESTSPPTAAVSNGLFFLGPVWRVKYPSRFNRDALCCDIFWNRTTRIRLVNVHLDSLPIQPNRRPRQVAIAASLLRTASVGRGVIAGDWNTVTEEDMALAQKNSLTDAWEHLHPGEDGFTWGLDGTGEPFPPGRLDRVAVLGIRLVDIRVVHPQTLPTAIDSRGERIASGNGEIVPWSDHSGLVCSFVIDGATGNDRND